MKYLVEIIYDIIILLSLKSIIWTTTLCISSFFWTNVMSSNFCLMTYTTLLRIIMIFTNDENSYDQVYRWYKIYLKVPLIWVVYMVFSSSISNITWLNIVATTKFEQMTINHRLHTIMCQWMFLFTQMKRMVFNVHA